MRDLESEVTRRCMQAARSTVARRIGAVHKEIALGCVRFGAPLTAVLPYVLLLYQFYARV
jgi:hypothetical protein